MGDDGPVAVPLVLAFGGLALVACLMPGDESPPQSSVLTAPATATVTAPITNTNIITITGQAPAPVAAPATSGVIGTASLALVLGSILAVGLVALLGGVAAAYLFGSQGGRRGLDRSGEYSYTPLTHEPRGRQ